MTLKWSLLAFNELLKLFTFSVQIFKSGKVVMTGASTLAKLHTAARKIAWIVRCGNFDIVHDHLSCISQRYPRTRRVMCLTAHDDRMLIGACNWVWCPIHVFRQVGFTGVTFSNYTVTNIVGASLGCWRSPPSPLCLHARYPPCMLGTPLTFSRIHFVGHGEPPRCRRALPLQGCTHRARAPQGARV